MGTGEGSAVDVVTGAGDALESAVPETTVDGGGDAARLAVVGAVAPVLGGGCCSVEPHPAVTRPAASTIDTIIFDVRRRVTIMRRQSWTGLTGRSR
jgi:hypothetical protein